MGDRKKTFVESEFIKKVNEAAERAYELKSAGNIGYKTEQNKLAALIIERMKNEKRQNTDPDTILGCTMETMVECIAKWKPGNHGFWGYYKNILDKRLKTEFSNSQDTFERGAKRSLKNIIKSNPNLTEEEKASLRLQYTRDYSYNGIDEDNNAKPLASNEKIEDVIFQEDMLEKHFRVLNKAVMTKKKYYENSPKICYTTYFYTEFVTERIHKEHDPSIFRKAENELMKVIDHDFISYYMYGGNSTVAEIFNGKLKELSCFGGDSNKPCGYPIKDKYVYVNYISMIKKCKKKITESSISQQRAKFDKLIELEMQKSISKK